MDWKVLKSKVAYTKALKQTMAIFKQNLGLQHMMSLNYCLYLSKTMKTRILFCLKSVQ